MPPIFPFIDEEEDPTEVDDVSEVKSDANTSTTGNRSAEEFLRASDGKKDSVLDSTQETSTSSPRSVEQIMEQMEEERKADNAKIKNALSPERVLADLKSKQPEPNKWAGVNKKADEAVDAVKDKVVDSAESAIKSGIASATGINLGGVKGVASLPSLIAAGSLVYRGIAADKEPKYDGPSPSDQQAEARTTEMLAPGSLTAPSEEAVRGYHSDIANASENGLKVKTLLFTDAQQAQWNGSDQQRFFSQHGDMIAHGNTEASYNEALLTAAFGKNPVGKSLADVPLKTKYLAEIEKDDNVMDINRMSIDDIIRGNVDLLDIGPMKEATENLYEVNHQREVSTVDKYAAEDHQLDARDAEKQAEIASTVESTRERTEELTAKQYEMAREVAGKALEEAESPAMVAEMALGGGSMGFF